MTFNEGLIPERLKEVRTEHRDSMRKLAEKIGSSKSSICFWEKGKIQNMKTSDINKVAEVYSIDPMWLMGFDVPERKEPVDHRDKRLSINKKLEFFTMEELNKVEQLVDLLISMEVK